MKRLREAPTTTGRPSATISARRRSSSRSRRGTDPMPGSSTRGLGSPPGREREPLFEEGRDLGDDVLVARVLLHGAGYPEHMHQAYIASRIAHDRDHRGIAAQRGDVVHERRHRPAGRPAPRSLWRCRSRGHPRLLRQPLEDGSTRRNSTSAGTVSAPAWSTRRRRHQVGTFRHEPRPAPAPRRSRGTPRPRRSRGHVSTPITAGRANRTSEAPASRSASARSR